jgi:hypothetical protein
VGKPPDVKLQFLRPLYTEQGGWISVYLDTSREPENASEMVSQRWLEARRQLEAAGAAKAALNAVGPAITAPGASPGRAVFAHGDRVAFSAALTTVPADEPVRLAPLPHVMPMLAQRAVMAAHVLVVATHEGGEITAVPAGVPTATSLQEVNGPGWPVHKTSVGGWSQDRYQRSVEHAWDENAKELAGQVAAAAARVSASSLIVAGDVRARALLLHHLATPLRDEAVVVDREVAADSPELAAAADEALRAQAARQAGQRLDEWRGLLPHGGGVEGLAATVAALRDGLVSDLLMLEDAGSQTAVWIGPGAEMALSEAEARERGVERPDQDRADAAIARGVVDTDAELWFLSPDGDGQRPRDGICAILRDTEKS